MFTTDSRTEQFLGVVGAKNHYDKSVTFDKLDPKWKEENLGRSQVIDEKAVQDYRNRMDKGSAAPAPILWANPKTGKFELLDGTQRVAAAELRRTVVFSAYVVTTKDEALIKRIRIFSNYRLQGGYQESAEWTLERAIKLMVIPREMTIEECAEFGGWSVAQIREKAAVVEFRLLVESTGGPERLPDTVIRVLAAHAHRTDFEAAPARIAEFTWALHKMRLSAEEAEPYIEEFFDIARSKGKIYDQFTQKWHEFYEGDGVQARIADPGRIKSQQMTPEGRLSKALKGALTAAERVVEAGETILGMDEYYQLLNQTKTTLQQIERQSKKDKRGKR